MKHKNKLNNSEHVSTLEEIGAISKGHFVLSSGLHSEYYVQCATIFQYPQIAAKICQDLAKKIKEKTSNKHIDYVVSPAMGGVLVGYEIARHLNCKNIFCERVDGKFTLRRNFSLNENDNIIVMEDVITTGKSSLETYECINSFKANIIAEGCIIDRRDVKGQIGNVPVISLIDLNIPTYTEKNLPDYLKNIQITKPGSRFLNKN